MSGNNSTEIVTQKELEGVLKNETFDKNQFLRIYEEWKQTHDTSLFAQLRSMHQNAGYKNKNIVFGSESEMHEIARIVQNYNERKSEVTTTTKQSTNAVAATTKPLRATKSSSIAPSSPELEAKNSLEKYESYATRELNKNNKTIKDLQEKLVEKKCYSGHITGKFDQATLEAVRVFQKTIPNPKYGSDGLVGSIETIPALFGIVTPVIDGSARNGIDAKKGSEKTIEKAKIPPVSSQQAPVASATPPVSVTQEINSSMSENKKNLTKAYDDFISYAKSTDKFLAGFRNSKEDIQNNQKTLSKKFEKFNTTLQSYIESGAKVEDINWMRLNIAYYYTDDLQGVSANNQLDIIASQNICLDILGNNISKLPTIEEQYDATMTRIQTTNPKLVDLISRKVTEQQERNESFNLSVILSNPFVKGGWEKAYDEIYGESLAKMDNDLNTLKGQKYDSLSDTEKKALNHLRDIRGKNGVFDFTVQNREQMWQMLKYGSAVATGIAGTALTASGIGLVGGAPLLAISGSIVAGAIVTTGGSLLAQGYHGSLGEVAGEAGINLISFGGGAILFKIASGAKAVAFAEKTSKVIVYGAEGVGNIGIGVSTDMLRAKLKGEDLDIYNSIQQNLIWAVLPFALRMKGVKVPTEVAKDAEHVENLVQAANVQAALGRSPKTLLEKAKAPLERLKFWGEKKGTVSSKTNSNTTPSDIDGSSMTHVTDDIHGAQSDILPSATSTATNNPALFSKQIEKSLKGLHKDGEFVVLGEYTITKDGKTFRVKGPDGEFVGRSDKNVVSLVKSHFQENHSGADAYIGSQIRAHIDTLPIGKNVKYGDVTVTKQKNGSLEVTGNNGKVLSGDELNNFYASNGEKILNSKMQSFLSTNGNKKIGETDKIFGISTSQLFENKGKIYNPLTWTKGIANMTWNELMQPVQTWNAFLGKGGALRTKDSPLGMTNNVLKAVVLRDVSMNWNSGSAAMRILGRGTLMTGATAAAANDIFGDNLPAQIASVPMLAGYSIATGDTRHSQDEVHKTAYSTYYAGMIWGNLLSQAIGGMPN